MPPASDDGWVAFDLLVCDKSNQNVCFPGSPFACDISTTRANKRTECPIYGTEAGKTYTLVAMAIKSGGQSSELSDPVEFTTGPHW